MVSSMITMCIRYVAAVCWALLVSFLMTGIQILIHTAVDVGVVAAGSRTHTILQEACLSPICVWQLKASIRLGLEEQWCRIYKDQTSPVLSIYRYHIIALLRILCDSFWSLLLAFIYNVTFMYLLEANKSDRLPLRSGHASSVDTETRTTTHGTAHLQIRA